MKIKIVIDTAGESGGGVLRCGSPPPMMRRGRRHRRRGVVWGRIYGVSSRGMLALLRNDMPQDEWVGIRTSGAHGDTRATGHPHIPIPLLLRDVGWRGRGGQNLFQNLFHFRGFESKRPGPALVSDPAVNVDHIKTVRPCR